MQKDFKKLIRRAEDQGWRVEKKKSGGKVLIYPPNGMSPVTIHQTNSDKRALKNTLSAMKQRGFEPGD